MVSRYLLVSSVCLILSSAFAVEVKPLSDSKVSPVDIVNQMEANGSHTGFRRNHAKGLCVEGSFKGTKDARELSSSNIFSASSVEVIGRFSNPGPNPNSPDNVPMPRGFAMQFRPNKGASTNMSMLDVPLFSVNTPDAFLELLRAKTPEQVAAFKEKHPESAPFFAFIKDFGVPQSYATVDYHSLHAFKFTNKKGKEQFVRWNFVSDQGNHFLTADQAKAKPSDFLSKALEEELKKGPVSWRMEAVLAKGGDSLTDPTVEWKGEHKKVQLGTLTIKKTSGNSSGNCDLINYDPNNLAEGIAPSDDQVLRFRSPAYAISFGKRVSEQAQKKQ